MTNKRKAELFDKAMDYIYTILQYDDRSVVEEVLESIWFTDEEIKEALTDTIYEEDEEE